ncbi:Alpha/beta hydrolase fold protein [Croceitalea dokdonensis DOKDO 023]|uniref:Alpha/beta hydrolase fold protein n=1 Tax=Croceitalea dokdonensis DOKDO 023 TaxID=1300341 RepID=A0A0P7B1I0_9FLAO|nr:alpha/beta fold hydrolase [Croceitalea dokdonensis]KPM32953.1 Alpha/beta hydrolase fold protein [Croceitalea dokdonensis DOKDO 023]
MPLVPSDYQPPFLFRNGHFSTIYSGVFRKIHGLVQKRERVVLPDGDFLDLDWSESSRPTSKLVILVHGLEGDAQRHYITGSAKQFNLDGYDACAINLRGCSGVPNNMYRSYHSGATEDLQSVIAHVIAQGNYNALYLMGFSLGGNLIMKYLGDTKTLPSRLKAAVGVSVPCDLKSACDELLKSKNVLYSKRFKKHLLAKLHEKRKKFPDRITVESIQSIATLKDFDDVYTGPAHGFRDALDYYAQCSCAPVLNNIQLPSLIINAKNDSFLGPSCYPIAQAAANDKLYLEMPDFGGHVGFWGKRNVSYVEMRAVRFFNELT